MEGGRTFLESSTIHGLSYISTTRRYARLLWMCIVIMGFSGAGYMIQEAFQNWAANPETTNIKTLTLSEITLPTMTVCPPKNTFTDLNYDLKQAENSTLTKEMRDVMFNFALVLIEDKMKNMHLS